MSKELLNFMTWVNQDEKLGYTSIGIERIVNKYIASKEKQKMNNKERHNQIIDKLYEDYLNNWSVEIDPNDGSVCSIDPIKVNPHTKEQFEYRLKTDPYFAGRWDSKSTIQIGPFNTRIAKIFQDELNKEKNRNI